MVKSLEIGGELLRAVPLNSPRNLLIGVRGVGDLAFLRSRHPASDWTVCEGDARYASEARTQANRLIANNFCEAADAIISIGGTYSSIVVGDLPDSQNTLRRSLERFYSLLQEGGHLVLSIKNIAHWSLIYALLSGSASAKAEHLGSQNFLSLDDVVQHLRSANFEILKISSQGGTFDRASAEKVISVLLDAVERLGIERQSYLRRSSPISYILVARKPAAGKPVRMLRLHISAMSPQFLDVRTRLPAEALNSLPDVFVTRAEKTLQLPAYPADVPKICVLQRLAISNEPAYLNWVRDRVREGWLLVAESDDHPALLAAVHGRNPEKESWLTVTGVHAVQTSTPALAEVYRTHNPEVATFPNAVFSLPPFLERAGPLRIFLGALNRERITRQVAQSLSTFCKAHPEAEFVVVHDRAFFDALPTPSKTFHPAASYDTYLDLMAGCHVALMPLEGTFGETFKSDVKFIEAASCSVAAIVSPTVYADTVVDGETGLIARAIEDWDRLLGELANDMARCQRLARNAWEYVRRERMFAAQVTERRAWYNSLWELRNELNTALLARHPQLDGG